MPPTNRSGEAQFATAQDTGAGSSAASSNTNSFQDANIPIFSSASAPLPDFGVNPINDLRELDDTDASQRVHIRIQQRNGRKSLTTVENVTEEFDLKLILRGFKQTFACNGTLTKNKEGKEIIVLQGDHRAAVKNFLVTEGICQKDMIQVHGF